ncbi:MAG: S1 RNA-binding domain-containing protein [Polyangiaceae bacterium]|nr:S1 RNA-binding domain-containing protein [Polyangiaceae bacterium]
MSQTDNPDPTASKPADAAAETSEVSDQAPNNPETSTLDGAPASVDAGSSAPADNADEGETNGEPGESAENAGEGAAQADAEGTQHKRKRRRRRKKKTGEGTHAGAEGGESATPAEGTAQAEGASPDHGTTHAPKPKKERPERERPAFNVGDVVFGKVIEFTDDALFVDLAGKAKAIFDLRELLITEDEAEEYNRAHTAERKQALEEREEGEHAGTPAVEGEAAAETPPAQITDTASAQTAPSDEEAPVQTAPSDEEELAEPAPAAEAEPAEPAEPTPAAEAPAATEGEAVASEAAASTVAPKEHEKSPPLPHVVLEPGAPFVGLVHNDGGRGGLVVLTHHPKRLAKAKRIVGDASKSGALVFGLVTGTIKGGVEVDVDGLRAFAPASHVELRPGADLSHLVGKRMTFAVTQYAKRGRDVVLSRRAMLESEAKEKREEALKKLEMGSVVEGIVRTVVPFGAFIDVGGVEGLVPLSEMSHNRADQPKDVFKAGETQKVKILRIDDKGKLWLSRRAAIEDPWSHVAQKYAPGTRHTGKVARLQPFGAFIELEPGIDGLIHTADLSVKRIEHPEEVVKVGSDIDVVVASVDSHQHRIALHPAPTGEAANETPQRVQLHKTVKVVVIGIETGGLSVRVLGATGRHARGFVSASATGTPRGTELRKLFPVGKELEVKVIEMDPRRGELKLSIKALNDETERTAYQQYRAQVKREAKFGTFADLLAKRNIPPTK